MAQGSFRRGPRSLPQLRIPKRFALESCARKIQQLRGLLRVQVRSNDFRFSGLQLDMCLKRRKLNLDSGAHCAQVRLIDLRKLISEMDVGENDRPAAGRMKRVSGPVEHVTPE